MARVVPPVAAAGAPPGPPLPKKRAKPPAKRPGKPAPKVGVCGVVVLVAKRLVSNCAISVGSAFFR